MRGIEASAWLFGTDARGVVSDTNKAIEKPSSLSYYKKGEEKIHL